MYELPFQIISDILQHGLGFRERKRVDSACMEWKYLVGDLAQLYGLCKELPPYYKHLQSLLMALEVLEDLELQDMAMVNV